jgi:uncharacterized protein with HEPN domain
MAVTERTLPLLGLFPTRSKLSCSNKNIPEEIRDEYPQIQWRAIAGIRDHLIHGYFGIDYDIVWDVLRNHFPALAETINEILLRDNIG